MISDEINLVAQLLGQTNSQLKRLDSQIISESGNLKRNSWNPNQILKQLIVNNQGAQPAPPQSAPPQHAPTPPRPVAANTTAQQPQIVQASPDIINRLESIESNIRVILDKIETIQSANSNLEKIFEKSLKNKIKQVTIKLDESKD